MELEENILFMTLEIMFKNGLLVQYNVSIDDTIDHQICSKYRGFPSKLSRLSNDVKGI